MNRAITTMILTLGLLLNLNGQTPIFHLDFNEESGSLSTIERISQTELTIQNAFERPERIEANFGSALRLDGYSTFLNDLNYFITDYSDELTIEVWYAAEAFTKEPAAIIQSQGNDGGFKLQTNSFGNIIFSFFFDGQERSLMPNKRLSPYRWHHIVATVNAQVGEANIYVNGEIWLTNKFQENATLNSTATTLWVAKSSLNQVFAGFSLNTLNGAIDDLKVYNEAFTEDQVLTNYSQGTIEEANLFIDPAIRFAEDYLRPRYHPMPNTAWTNESYGLTYYNGKYHLFFQKNPNGPYLYFMHWGHLSSPDLVSWEEEKIPLAPSPGFDNFGVWSGTTTFDPLGEPMIFYTGVDGVKAGIGSARLLDTDLNQWEKNRSNPLIANPPPNFFSLDFRDPYIFQKNDLYYMIVGSGLSNNGGGILFTYTSTDLVSWQLVNPLFQSTDFINHGTFWEMPSFVQLTEDDYALVVTPQFPGAPADAIYWIGSFDGSIFQPYDQEPKLLELVSRNLLAPAFGRDEEQRWTYIGIIPEDRDIGLQIESGWRNIFSLPRIVRLLDDKRTLAAVPHPNLCRMRQDSVVIDNRSILSNTNANLQEFSGNQCEMEFMLNFSNAESIHLHVFKNANGTEKTEIILDKKNNRIGINRTQSSPYPTVEDLRYQDYRFNQSGDVYVRVFLDHSTLEVFVDNLVVFSVRVYPSENSRIVDIQTSTGEVLLKKFKGYNLAGKENIFENLSCPTEELPNTLNTSIINIAANQQIKIFPNPTGDILNIQSETRNSAKIFDLQGRCLQSHPDYIDKIDVSRLKAGIYVLQLSNEYGSFTGKIIKQ